MKKLKVTACAMGLALLLSACSGEEEKAEPKDKTETAEKQENVKNEENMADKSDVTKSDEDMKKEIEKEKGISQVSLIIRQDGPIGFRSGCRHEKGRGEAISR